ncbi:MAG: hypothetical protein JKY19_11195 [Alcanivoracaceae bacterium]|nr:hypothetical protein [Alcanivoracaceae bacterium]
MFNNRLNKRGAVFSAIILILLVFSSSSMANNNPVISRADALTFAFIADFSSGIKCYELTHHDCRINVSIDKGSSMAMQATTLLIMRIDAALDERSLNDWTTGWGPTMQWEKGFKPGAKSGIKYYSTASTMVVFKNNNTYVVAIAGTNPISTYGWNVEDFDITQLVNWPNGSPAGKISAGTAEGLNLLLTMGGGQSAGTNTTLIDYLREEAKAAHYRNEKIEVVVVGHSLGGTLSPVIATTLIDTKNENLDLKWSISQTSQDINLQLKEWDPGNTAKVSTIFFAGATPGDKNFANYANSLMTGISGILGINNKYDVVPHGWNDLGSIVSTGSANIKNIYTVNSHYCDTPSSQTNCPYTKTKPVSSDPSKVICPCLATSNEIFKAQYGAEADFPKATPVGVGSQREEIILGIAYKTKWQECPSTKLLSSIPGLDRMLIEAIYQHDCVYPLNYQSTKDLYSVLHKIREEYKQTL